MKIILRLNLMTAATWLAIVLAQIFSARLHAGLLLDGNFNSLPVSSAPSVGVPAGNWAFPAAYVADGVAETNITEFSIVNDPATPGFGRCLGLFASPVLSGNQHLPNIFLTPATTADIGLQVDFDIYVRSGHGGGAIYLGNSDFSFSSSARGPQVVWFSTGEMVAVDSDVNLITITNAFPVGVWQSVRLMVNLTAGSYDFYWAVRGNPLLLLATDLPFRGGFQSSFDRITVARFEADPDVDSAFDNFAVEKVAPPFSVAIAPILANKVVVTFPTVSEFNYITEFTTALTNSSWTAIATNSGTGKTISITNQITQATGFFRVRAE